MILALHTCNSAISTLEPQLNIGVHARGRAQVAEYHGGVPRAQSYAYVVLKYQLGVFIITNQSGDTTAGAMETALAHIFDAVESMEQAKLAVGPR